MQLALPPWRHKSCPAHTDTGLRRATISSFASLSNPCTVLGVSPTLGQDPCLLPLQQVPAKGEGSGGGGYLEDDAGPKNIGRELVTDVGLQHGRQLLEDCAGPQLCNICRSPAISQVNPGI